jgi:hypothetical protein
MAGHRAPLCPSKVVEQFHLSSSDADLAFRKQLVGREVLGAARASGCLLGPGGGVSPRHIGERGNVSKRLRVPSDMIRFGDRSEASAS